jgi:phosphoribosylglycinamide formyltransferase-1
MLKTKIAVLVSGGGTNLQALIDAQKTGRLKSGEISLVLSSNSGAYALTRAAENGIHAVAVPRKNCVDQAEFERRLLAQLDAYGIELLVLAGFMCILSADFTRRYPRRILYGLRVHEAALAAGVKVTGATVHFVNEIPDGGEILLQKAVPVRRGDTPEKLQRRVMEQAEWKLLPRAAEQAARVIQKAKGEKA